MVTRENRAGRESRGNRSGKERWSVKGNVLLVLLFSALFVEAVMAYQMLSPGDCKLNDSLFWSVDGGCKDLSTTVVWSAPKMRETDSYATYGGAQHYCDNLEEGGYSDWRVPTVAEMQTVAVNGAGTHLNLVVGDYDTAYTHARWASDTRGKKYGYVVVLGSGETHLVTQDSIMDVVCVRK